MLYLAVFARSCLSSFPALLDARLEHLGYPAA